jgi:hypothetical protein
MLRAYFTPRFHLPEWVREAVEEVKRGETTESWSGEYVVRLVRGDLPPRVEVLRIVAVEDL